jgi:hypothetical protein
MRCRRAGPASRRAAHLRSGRHEPTLCGGSGRHGQLCAAAGEPPKEMAGPGRQDTPRHGRSRGCAHAARVPSACGRSVLAPPVNPPCVTPSRMGCPTGAGPRRSPERSASSSAPPPLARVATTRGASGLHGWDVTRGRCSKQLAHHMGAITRCRCHHNLTRAAASRAHDMECTTRDDILDACGGGTSTFFSE